MNTDALLGGIETVRNHVNDLMDLCQDSHPNAYSVLACIDCELEELGRSYDDPGDEEIIYLGDDEELFTELREAGMLTPADIDANLDSLFGDA